MPIPSRTLSLGLSGTDVRDTQTALSQLGYSISAADRQASTYGQTTHDAVAALQTARGLPSTGTVDAATASAIAEAVAEASFAVSGRVSSPSNAGVGGLTVTLVDKNVGGDVPVGTATTDARGGYAAGFVIALPVLAQRRKTAPDLQARVSSGTGFLAASEVIYNAPASITLDVALPANAALPSEYETLIAALANSYGGSLTALQENDARQDISYLANKTGWDARAVALASLAAQFGQLVPTPPAGTAPIAVPVPVIRPEFYYALFRAGLPASADTLYQADAKSVTAVWTQAVAQGVIPAALAAQIPAAVATYQTFAAAAALTAKPAIGISPIKDLLQVSMPDANQQTQFAQLYTQYAGDTAGLWNAVTKTFGAAVAARLQLDGQLGYITINNAPLLTALHAAETASPLAAAADLATRGYYAAAKWQKLIGTSVPAQIPGATPAEQAGNYAGLLSAQVRIAFPTLVIADLVRQSKLPVQGDATVATGVAAFLTANQGKFEIGIEPVEAYVARAKITGTAPEVVTQIKRLQRVYQLTPDDQSMTVLLQANSRFRGRHPALRRFGIRRQLRRGPGRRGDGREDLRPGPAYSWQCPQHRHALPGGAAGTGARRRIDRADPRHPLEAGCGGGEPGRRLSDLTDPARIDGLLPLRGLPVDPQPRRLPGRPAALHRLPDAGQRLPESPGGAASAAAGPAAAAAHLRQYQHGLALYRHRQRDPGIFRRQQLLARRLRRLQHRRPHRLRRAAGDSAERR